MQKEKHKLWKPYVYCILKKKKEKKRRTLLYSNFQSCRCVITGYWYYEIKPKYLTKWNCVDVFDATTKDRALAYSIINRMFFFLLKMNYDWLSTVLPLMCCMDKFEDRQQTFINTFTYTQIDTKIQCNNRLRLLKVIRAYFFMSFFFNIAEFRCRSTKEWTIGRIFLDT